LSDDVGARLKALVARFLPATTVDADLAAADDDELLKMVEDRLGGTDE
jgi:hypothetical protein